MNMYVSNLDFQVKEEDLRQLFAQFGEVTSVKVIKDRETGRSRGFGFVEMSSDEAANNAITSLNNKELSGRAISVSQAKEREDRPRRSLW
ncbi:RNA-binding protein [Parasegetibacter sp. MAH-26]|uniref:RNA-binding protein n=2 Tax=Pinibacter aurantiacus TaxID=2851599 RepID=A0A9E2SF15_9BACT|nr:RNA-binding protein [Pinibacter aurantiacus]MBV4360412.1 RNA-binding protein [Pinibacter aurantiacus]